ncbi:uncharacterized protein LOC108740369 isoform X2 [Agrilus planipennis]|uniref:Uncharacterized protein LOC108740369 isoform X2 n=1 Tax=Agrilus planipennis TaxID=224129 RepID=A0A1W4XCL5_AGRPL|nr:uncharacterized protein LOC108740369 isoform X2 [Agrilus planipennis]
MQDFNFLRRDGEKTLLITKARSAEQSVIWRDGGGGGCVEGGGGGVGSGGGGADRRGTSARRAPSLRLANGRVAAAQSEEEIRSPPPRRLAKDDSIKISIENTNTCTDSLVTALDDETLLIQDFLSNDMNYKGSGKVHFGVDDVSLYGTPKEEPGPTPLGSAEVKQSFLKNQLQALFQPTDNKLAMKLFGSKKALMKERIRQKASGHWVIHPCSSFR